MGRPNQPLRQPRAARRRAAGLLLLLSGWLAGSTGCGPGAAPASDGASLEDASSEDLPSPGPPASRRAQIFLIDLRDGGRSGRLVGCGDSVVPVTVMVDAGRPRAEGALRALLELEREALGGPDLTNALFRSRLRLESLRVDAGRAEVHLGGELRLGGVCDPPRVRAQLEQTVLATEGIESVEIWIGGRPLDEVLDRRGKPPPGSAPESP